MDLEKYIRTQIARTPDRLNGFVVDPQGQELPHRKLYKDLQSYIDNFHEHGEEPRWIIVPGLRGVGKTTLLAQLFLEALPTRKINTLYLSVDEIVRRFDANLWDVIEAYENILGHPLERLKHKTYFFFDEVHYDPKWDAALKTFYDRSRNLFMLVTGSSATLLRRQISADSARRSYFAELFPLRFPEYMYLHRATGLPEIGDKLKNAFWRSSAPRQVLTKLKKINPDIKQYWMGFDNHDLTRFLKFGTLTFTLSIADESVIINQTEQVIQKIIYTDIAQLNRFDQATLNKLYALLSLLAENKAGSLANIAGELDVAKQTAISMLAALEDAGLTHRIPPFGREHSRKSPKYVFASPAIRHFLLSSQGITSLRSYQDHLFQDVSALSLRHNLKQFPKSSLEYDPIKDGSDFIARVGNKSIPVTISSKPKTAIKKLQRTCERVKHPYALLVTDTASPSLNKKVITIPLHHWLLV